MCCCLGHDLADAANLSSLSAQPSWTLIGLRFYQRYRDVIGEASYIHSQVLLRRPWSKFHPDCTQQDSKL